MDQLALILQGKEVIYKLASDIFLFPPDKGQIQSYLDIFDCMKNPEYDTMLSEIKKYRMMTSDEVSKYLIDLNRNYTYMFCFGNLTPVTESAYTTSGGLNNASDIDGIEAMYAQSGYKIYTGGSNEPADHIGVELGFLADLSRKSLLFLKNNNLDEVHKGLVIQKQFLEKHLLHWISDFCSKVKSRQEVVIYYLPIVSFLEAFIKEDYETVSELLEAG